MYDTIKLVFLEAENPPTDRLTALGSPTQCGLAEPERLEIKLPLLGP